MIKLIPNTKELIDVELNIMNSNPDYNLWASGKPTLVTEDILKEHTQSEELGSKRWLVEYGGKKIGIIDYLPKNPKDGFPWIGLFVLHKGFHGVGLSTNVYNQLEEKLRHFGHEEIRLAVLKENQPGIRFWSKQGYEKYSESELEGRPIEKMRKDITVG